jgi:aminoglycoside phosphotransferase (APT) family kinase protein
MKPIAIQEIPKHIQNDVGTIYAIHFPKQGYTSDVGIIETANGTYVVKRAKGERFCASLAKDAKVLTCLSSTALPIPTLYRFHETKHKKEAWALLEYIEGETLRQALEKETNEAKRQEMIFRFGEMLAKIHSTPCPRELIGQKPWLDEMLEKAAYHLAHDHVDGTAELLDELMKKRPAPCPPTLIHGDFTIDNVLVRDGNIAGVIDWSGGAFGDPRYDAALAIRPKRNAFQHESDVIVFFEGYGQKPITKEEYEYFANGLYEFF